MPQLADEGLYLASESTMYRVQQRHGLVPQRRPGDIDRVLGARGPVVAEQNHRG